jgi:hypothetical protein
MVVILFGPNKPGDVAGVEDTCSISASTTDVREGRMLLRLFPKKKEEEELVKNLSCTPPPPPKQNGL